MAALLNSADPDVEYSRTTADVIRDVQEALASGDVNTILALAAALENENSAQTHN